jgi:hypothetical protein
MALSANGIVLPSVAAETGLRHDLAINFMPGDVIATVGIDPIGSISMLLTRFQFIFGRVAISAKRFTMTG